MGQVETIEKTYCPECGEEFDAGTRNCPNDGSRLYSYRLRNEEIDPLVGEVLDDRFQIEGVIGEGGMGRVYRGVQLSVQRPVALKVLRPDLIERENVIQRFLREARVISGFNHPNIVNMVEFGQDGDRDLLYLAMELLDGIPLSEVLQRGRAHPNLVCEIAIQVCQGLAEAHAREIVHRDLKPDNLMLVLMSDGSIQVKILDFGIAHAVQGEKRLTSTGQVFGTAHYMAPEQAAGKKIGGGTDVYALGCILYEMICGQLPFNSPSVMGLLVAHVQEEPPHLSTKVVEPDVPAELVTLVMQMLEKDPADRPDGVLGVRDAVEEIRRNAGWGPVRNDRNVTLEEGLVSAWLRGSFTPKLRETSDALERVTREDPGFETAETAAHPSAPSIEQVPTFDSAPPTPSKADEPEEPPAAESPAPVSAPLSAPAISAPNPMVAPLHSDPSIEFAMAQDDKKRLLVLAAVLLVAVMVVSFVLLQVVNSSNDAVANDGATTPTETGAMAATVETPELSPTEPAAGAADVDAGVVDSGRAVPVAPTIEDKPDVPQPVVKKPVEKKPVEKKPVEKKPVVKKPVEKKPVEKKPAETTEDKTETKPKLNVAPLGLDD